MVFNIWGFNAVWGVVAVLAAIYVIYDVMVNNKRLSDGMKVFWIIFVLLFSIITATVYFFVGRDGKNDLFSRRRK